MKRNGLIEFLRFYFAFFVLLHHTVKDFYGPKAPYFYGGYFAVSFFFVLSGFLMARSVRNENKGGGGMSEGFLAQGEATFQYLGRKIGHLFLDHAIAWVFALAVFLFLRGGGFEIVFRAIPSFFFLHPCLGFNTPMILGVEWYLCAMFVGMALLYPLCRMNYRAFVRLIAPLVIVLVLGYLFHKAGHGFRGFGEVFVWDGVLPKSVLRAVADLALGAVAFEFCEFLREKGRTPLHVFALTTLQVGSFLFLTWMMVGNPGDRFAMTGLLSTFALASVSFSGRTWWACWFDNRFCRFLGALSLPLYLMHRPILQLVGKLGFCPLRSSAIAVILSLFAAVVAFALAATIRHFHHIQRGADK